MKTLKYKRLPKLGNATVATIDIPLGCEIILDFGKKEGGKIKLNTDFIADSIEHYLEYIIKEYINATKIGKKSKSNKS